MKKKPFISKCPVSTAMDYMGKKWTFEIVRDLFFGKKHFNEFLESNITEKGSLSSKVLTDRLYELQEKGIIEKEVKKTFPISTEYRLTKKGKALNKIIYRVDIISTGRSAYGNADVRGVDNSIVINCARGRVGPIIPENTPVNIINNIIPDLKHSVSSSIIHPDTVSSTAAVRRPYNVI